MKIELRQWYFGDEPKLIDLYNRYDRSHTDFSHPAPGECTQSDANFRYGAQIEWGKSSPVGSRPRLICAAPTGFIKPRRGFRSIGSHSYTTEHKTIVFFSFAVT